MKRVVLQALRTAQGPLNSKVLTEIVLKQRGLGSTNASRLRGTITKRVCAALRHFRIRALVVSEKGADGLFGVAVEIVAFGLPDLPIVNPLRVRHIDNHGESALTHGLANHI